MFHSVFGFLGGWKFNVTETTSRVMHTFTRKIHCFYCSVMREYFMNVFLGDIPGQASNMNATRSLFWGTFTAFPFRRRCSVTQLQHECIILKVQLIHINEITCKHTETYVSTFQRSSSFDLHFGWPFYLQSCSGFDCEIYSWIYFCFDFCWPMELV